MTTEGQEMVDLDVETPEGGGGCGFWVATSDQPMPPDEWWECVIPDADHGGRDHTLRRKTRTAGGAL